MLSLRLNKSNSFLLCTFFPITHRFNQAVRTEKVIQFWILMKLHGYDLWVVDKLIAFTLSQILVWFPSTFSENHSVPHVTNQVTADRLDSVKIAYKSV